MEQKGHCCGYKEHLKFLIMLMDNLSCGPDMNNKTQHLSFLLYYQNTNYIIIGINTNVAKSLSHELEGAKESSVLKCRIT
jgi:hypothetical protein